MKLFKREIRCGKNCLGCPHGHYYYFQYRSSGRRRSIYLGKEPPKPKKLKALVKMAWEEQGEREPFEDVWQRFLEEGLA
jgi:hypothetical protein